MKEAKIGSGDVKHASTVLKPYKTIKSFTQ